MKLSRVEHGGGLTCGRRKTARPVSTRQPMYVVLRSTRAKGQLWLRRPTISSRIRAIISKQAEACRIELLQFANEGDSLHFLIRVPSRAAYQRFIRSVSGVITRQVTGIERGPAHGMRRSVARGAPQNGRNNRGRFWDVLPYSRICTGATSISSAQRLIAVEVRREIGLQSRTR